MYKALLQLYNLFIPYFVSLPTKFINEKKKFSHMHLSDTVRLKFLKYTSIN